jgi:8-oxo-dGTP pyrophosphatase MutT (NUDIX family)
MEDLEVKIFNYGLIKFRNSGLEVMHNFAEKLKYELSKGLPGTGVQWEMAPKDRISEFPLAPGDNTLNASVLILLYPQNNSVYTVFIQRQIYDGIHSGQISFPGGKKEPPDESVVQTAMREAKEEIGIDPSGISVIGTLTPLFIPASNIMVTPVIGWMSARPDFHLDFKEVKYLINADLKKLIEPSMVKIKPYEIRGRIIEVKYFDYENNMIWGATAMILQELLTVVKSANLFFSEGIS